MRKVSYEYKLTPEGVAQNKMINGTVFKAEDFAIDIPVQRSLDDYDIFDGYDLGENW